MGRVAKGAGLLAVLLPMVGQGVFAAADDRLRQLQLNKAALARAADAGHKVASFCFNCHGEDGHSKMADVPNLAGQSPAYLVEQLLRFGAGTRKNEFMQGLAKVLSDEDRVNVAVFFATQPPRPAAASAGGAEVSGRDIYKRECISCHGEKGYGHDQIPRLAGQQKEYLMRSMPRHRERAGEHADKKAMREAMARLSDSDMRQVAAYLSALK